MESFNFPGLSLRDDLRVGDIGRLIEFSGIYGHSDYSYPIAFEGYVAKTFAEIVIDPLPLNHIWMVEDDKGLVGTIGVVDRGQAAQLRWFSVKPEWRGKKLGKYLFDSALDYIRKNGFQRAWLSTFSESELAIELYKRRGFQIKKESDIDIGGKSYHELILEKTINT